MSSKFFENKECEYYPCHKLNEINCLFCFCPIFDWCTDRECKECLYPHKRENYDKIIKRLGG
jgi:Zn-finger protein